MTTRERLGTAQHTDDLGEVGLEEVGDVDIVRSCGMEAQANPLGLSVWRWRVGGDQREVFAIGTALVDRGHDPQLVYRVLSHLANDVCSACEGRGYEMLPGAPVLSDVICVACQGTGRRPLEGAAERELQEELMKAERTFAAAVMRRLARELDL